MLFLHGDSAVPDSCLRSAVVVCVHTGAGVRTVAGGSARQLIASLLLLLCSCCPWRTLCCWQLLAFPLFACAPVVAGIPSLASVPAVAGVSTLTVVLVVADIPATAGVPDVTRPYIYWRPFDADIFAGGGNVAVALAIADVDGCVNSVALVIKYETHQNIGYTIRPANKETYIS